MSLSVLIPLSNHDFLKSILKLGLNQIGVSCMISICRIISALNGDSTLLMKSDKKGLYITSLILSILSGPNVKISYMSQKVGNTWVARKATLNV